MALRERRFESIDVLGGLGRRGVCHDEAEQLTA
jgi:hypothetical protein